MLARSVIALMRATFGGSVERGCAATEANVMVSSRNRSMPGFRRYLRCAALMNAVRRVVVVGRRGSW